MKKIFSFLMAGTLILAVSCKKDEQKVLSATDAKSALDEGTSSITNELNGITSTQSYQAISNLENASAPFGNPMKSVVATLKAKNLKSLKAVKGDNFDFDAAKGEWEYVYPADTIRKKAGSTVSDKMILYFPSDSNHMETNDATLTVYEFSSQMKIKDPGTYWADTSYLPTKITADIKIGTNVIASVNFTASFNDDGVPTMLNASITLDDYTITAKYSESGAKQSASVSAKKGSKILVAVNVTLTYPSATDREKPDYVDGSIQVENLKLQGNANIKTLSTATNVTSADINANIRLTLVRASDGAKIGDIKAYDESDGKGGTAPVAYIVFADGSKEKAETYLNKIKDEMPNIASNK